MNRSMRRYVIHILLPLLLLVPSASRANYYYDIYYDYETSALLLSTFEAQLILENKTADYLDDILKSYGKANLAISGIYLAKNLERKALHDAGLLGVAGHENYYYQHIYKLVYSRIIPQILRCGVLLIDHIDQAYIWGPNLHLICEDVRQLCAQFSAVCSNGTLTFNFDFPQIADEFLEVIGYKDLAKVDWRDFYDGICDIPANADSLYEDFKLDLDNLYRAGASLYSATDSTTTGLWHGGGRVGELFKGKPSEIKGKIDSLKAFFEETTDKYQVKDKLDGFFGAVDSVTVLSKLFKSRSCDPAEYIYDFSQDGRRNVYYKERWFITDGRNVVYEDWYDSYTMNESTFQQIMENKLQEFNDPDRSPLEPPYYIDRDQRTEYTKTDELMMEGVNQAIFTVRCDDGGNMAEGDYTFKVNPRHDPLDEKSKDYAMATSLEENTTESSDRATCEDKVSYWQGEYDTYSAEYDALDEKIDDLYAAYNDGQMTYNGQDILTAINGLATDRTAAGRKRDAAGDSLNVWSNVYEELMGDLVDDGDIFRIPHIMNMYQGLFSLRWLDSGHWEGYTWVRRAYVPSADVEVTLKVELKRARGESVFLGIRYHRSQITMDYKLTYESESENVVEYLDLDPSKSEADNRGIILDRQNFWQNEFPDCTVEVDTRQQDAVKDSINDHRVHLLWASDRIRVARAINAKLELIYARLQVMERVLLTSKSLVNRVRDEIHNIVTDPLGREWCNEFLQGRLGRMRENVNARPVSRRRGRGGGS